MKWKLDTGDTQLIDRRTDPLLSVYYKSLISSNKLAENWSFTAKHVAMQLDDAHVHRKEGILEKKKLREIDALHLKVVFFKCLFNFWGKKVMYVSIATVNFDLD